MESNHPENLCVGGTDGQQPAGLAVAGRIWRHHPAGHRPVWLGESGILTVDNWANLLQGSAILLIVAMAMTLIVSAGAIDLSVGVALDFGAAFALVALEKPGICRGSRWLRPAWRGADWPAQCLSDPHLPGSVPSRHARHLVYRQQRRAHLYRRRRRDSLSADGSGVSRPGGGQPWRDPHAGSDRAGAVAGGLAGYRAHPVGANMSAPSVRTAKRRVSPGSAIA